jgi:integrase
MLKVVIKPVERAEERSRSTAARTLANVRDILLAGQDADALDTRLQISAINTVARALRCAPEDIPADPAGLRQHLSNISPAMAGLTRQSWWSVRSRIRKALQRASISVMPGRRTDPLSTEWHQLYGALPEIGRSRRLCRFIGWLSAQAICPPDVSDDVVARFEDTVRTTSLRGNPSEIVRGAIRGWNAAVDQVPGWPQKRLTLAERQRNGYVLPTASFPLGFQSSLADYIAFLTDPPEDDDAPFRGLRPNTLALREFQFRQMASALVHQGLPIDDITSIGVLAQHESVEMICDFFLARNGGTISEQLGGMLTVLRPIATYQLKNRELAEWIRRRLRRLSGGRVRRFGITEKNRRRIVLFRDAKHVRDLLVFPYKLLKRAEGPSLSAKKAAALVRTAVAIELEIMCPVRLQNLSEIDVDTDLVRSRSGKGASVNLFIPGKRTKNGEDIELELPKQSVGLIDLYLAKYRNELILPEHRGTGPRYLFPRPDGIAMSGKSLAFTICYALWRDLGIKFNVHLFRHLGCFLYLRSHPGQLDVMRRVLGHRDGETTRRFYAFVEQSQAFQLFDQHVLNLRDSALRPSKTATTASKGSRR